jgi:uncharacterized protein YgiM (DUF1202 family)
VRCVISPPAPNSIILRSARLAILVLLSCLFAGCSRNSSTSVESAYVTAVQASLRDRVAAVYNKTGSVMNGERVDIIEHSHNGRFVRVRDSRGEEGWLEQRFLTDEAVFQSLQKLARENAAIPAQAVATTRADLNMHVTPARDSDHLYQLKEGEKLEVLKRAASPKAAKPENPVPIVADAANSPPAYEDWYLVRDSRHRYGWVLSRMIDLDVPLEVAQYAEGQRIIAAFVLNSVTDQGKPVPQYLLLLNEPKDGTPQDFNQLRVFTWNTKRHHYETAYRERNLDGVLPARAGTASFGKEGALPTFTVSVRTQSGAIDERQYKLNGVMVRRVLAPGQEPARPERRVHSKRPK